MHYRGCKNYFRMLLMLLFFISVADGKSGVHENTSSNPEDITLTLTKEAPDSLEEKIFRLFSRWKLLVLSSRILDQVAEEEGITVSAEETSRMVASLVAAFPGMGVDTLRLNKTIRNQKYLMRKIGFSPTSQAVDEKCRNYLEETPLTPPPTLDQLINVMTSSVIFSMDTVKRFCEQLQLKREEKDRAQLREQNKPWPQKLIAIDSEPGECLVVSGEDDSCIIRVKDFNTFVSLYPMQKCIRIDTARSMIVITMLKNIYQARKAELNGLKENKLLFEKQNVKERKRRILNKIFPHSTGDDTDSILRPLYDKYYDELFRSNRIKTFRLFGSSDSSYIDSIFQCMRTVSSRGTISEKKSLLSSLPWVEMTSDNIPDTILNCIDTLKIQRFCRVATPFGYFICRLVNIERKSEIPYSEARPHLLYILDAERKRGGGKLDSVQAYDYYRKNISSFITPDTLYTKAWLSPVYDTIRHSDDKKVNKCFTGDKMGFNPIIVCSDDLPKEVRTSLYSLYNEHEQSTDCSDGLLGPHYNEYGTWFFHVNEHVAGGDTIPYDSVRNDILRKMRITEFPMDSTLKTKKGKEMNAMAVWAGVYRKYDHEMQRKKIDEIPEEKLMAMIKNKKIKIAYSDGSESDGRLLKNARFIMLDQLEMEAKEACDTWINKQKIDRTLLFKGCQIENSANVILKKEIGM